MIHLTLLDNIIAGVVIIFIIVPVLLVFRIFLGFIELVEEVLAWIYSK